ncbi:MAG: DUF4040 domain-containing protein [Anaerolineae bacterium]|nr:DUF4040 domain-containing protein [Anaerolineae bacterium]
MFGIGIISLAPAITALLRPAVRKFISKEIYGWLLAGLVSILFVWLLTFIPIVSEVEHVAVSVPWVPQLGLTLSIYLDGLSLLFSLMILGIGAMIVLYSIYYFDDAQSLDRFYTLLLPFMSAMLVVVLAGNVLTLFIGWELTSVISFLLVSFNGENEAARKGALQALIITGGGGLALMVGLVMLGTAAGSMELNQIIANTSLRDDPLYSAFTVLILLGCFTKSAQFPFHFWLPGAMSAPTPASAYLHSATMVKAGIYLLLRLAPALGDTPLWQNGLLFIGLVTGLMGALFALRQTDLKAALAYATVSQLGILVALISLPHGEGLKAAAVGILAHGLYKATLFLTVGAVDHATSTRDMRYLGGLRQQMPGWAVVAVIAGLSMAGIPPLLGFVAKESLLEAMLNTPLSLAVIVISAALTVALAFILVWDVFGGKVAQNTYFHATPKGLLIGPVSLAGLSLLAGVGLPVLIAPLIETIVGKETHLALFSGFGTPFLLSLTAIASGLAVFATRSIWRGWAFPALPTGTQIYQGAVHSIEHVGDLLLRTQGGKLRYYLAVILSSVIVLQATAGLAHLTNAALVFEFHPSLDILRTVLLILCLSMMLASILFKNHLIAALSLGVAGYSVGGLFLIEPAPDVALVQFMVETIGTVLLIVMLARIRSVERKQAIDSLWNQSRIGLVRDVLIAAGIGIGVGLFVLAALTNRPQPQSIATWHLEHTEEMVGFPDVVGAIVTDFRGMDTIIEITVFGVAALGVITILAKPSGGPRWPVSMVKVVTSIQQTIRKPVSEVENFIPPPYLDDHDTHGEDLFLPSFSTPLTRVITRIILPLAFLVALAHLFYGGDGPGDGFTAGVVSGLGVALWYIVFGYHEAHTQFKRLGARRLIGIGVALVIANAAFPMLLGRPFLSHLNFDLPLPANIHLSSTFVYETGIFLTVLGSITTVMEAIAYPKEVEPL